MKLIPVRKCGECPNIRSTTNIYQQRIKVCAADPVNRRLIESEDSIPSWCPLKDGDGVVEALKYSLRKLKKHLNWVAGYSAPNSELPGWHEKFNKVMWLQEQLEALGEE